MLSKKRISGESRQPPMNHHLFRYALLVALATVCVGLVSLPPERPASRRIEIVAVYAEELEECDLGPMQMDSSCGVISPTPAYPVNGESLLTPWIMEEGYRFNKCLFIVPPWAAEDLIPDMTGIFNYGCGLQLP